MQRWHLVALTVLHGAGLLLFVSGVLLTRFEVATRSECAEGLGAGDARRGCWMPRRFDTAVFVIIDALRYDFAAPDAPVDEHSQTYRGHLPVIGQYLDQQPRDTRLFRFVADGPTTTLQRLKGLTTGSLPTFIDVGTNFNSDAIVEDNWVAQLASHGWHLSFSGDDTWMAVFPEGFDEAHAYPSFNVKDLHGVDEGVIEHLLPSVHRSIAAQSSARTGDHRAGNGSASSVGSMVVAHYLGVDHCGHRFGPSHHEMESKLKQMNSELVKLLESVDEHTVVFVMGDHGMTATGDHGGETRDEVDAALFAYTPAGFGHPPSSALGLGVGTADGMGAVRQTDLVPTLALALGVPIPFGNLGGALIELALPPPDANASRKNAALQWHGWTIVALHANAVQVWRYLEEYQHTAKVFPADKMRDFAERFASIEADIGRLKLLLPEHFKGRIEFGVAHERAEEMAHSLALKLTGFLRDIAAFCRERFATFDLFAMGTGLAIMIVSTASMAALGLRKLLAAAAQPTAAAPSLRTSILQTGIAGGPSSPMQSFVQEMEHMADLRLGQTAVGGYPPPVSARRWYEAFLSHDIE